MKKISFLAIAALAVALAAAAVVAGAKEMKGSPLDGTKWQVTMMAKGEKPMPDTLTFGKGRFDSIACHPYGFGTAAYKAKKVGNDWKFRAVTRSAKEGTMHWKGKVTGGKISGAIVWKNAKGEITKMTYSGKKRA